MPGRKNTETARLKELMTIPGVGPSIAQDLWELGLRKVVDLKGASPEALYAAHCDAKGMTIDRCWLYVARCAVYFASTKRHDPEKLKWWNWKDKEGEKGGAGERAKGKREKKKK